jgi:hypothetical protein
VFNQVVKVAPGFRCRLDISLSFRIELRDHRSFDDYLIAQQNILLASKIHKHIHTVLVNNIGVQNVLIINLSFLYHSSS